MVSRWTNEYALGRSRLRHKPPSCLGSTCILRLGGEPSVLLMPAQSLRITYLKHSSQLLHHPLSYRSSCALSTRFRPIFCRLLCSRDYARPPRTVPRPSPNVTNRGLARKLETPPGQARRSSDLLNARPSLSRSGQAAVHARLGS